MSTRNRWAAVATLVVALVSTASCGRSTTTSARNSPGAASATATWAQAKDSVIITDLWAPPTPPMASAGVVYLTVKSRAGDRLLKASASTSLAARAGIHETTTGPPMRGGTGMGEMKMRPVASIELRPGQPVQLKPGGYHIMLTDLVKPLRAGDRIALTLTFDKAGERTVTAIVRDR